MGDAHILFAYRDSKSVTAWLDSSMAGWTTPTMDPSLVSLVLYLPPACGELH